MGADSTLIERADRLKAGALLDGVVIDSDLQMSAVLSSEVLGIGWDHYKLFGAIGYAWFPIDLISRRYFLKVLLRLDAGRHIDLEEAKEILVSAIERNPDQYTHCPPSELIKRIRKSKSIEAAMRKFSSD